MVRPVILDHREGVDPTDAVDRVLGYHYHPNTPSYPYKHLKMIMVLMTRKTTDQLVKGLGTGLPLHNPMSNDLLHATIVTPILSQGKRD